MTNLIPAIAKKQIVLEYWVRLVSVWVIVWSLSLLVSAVLLWPTYVLIVGSSAAYADSVADASERTAEYNEISQSLTQSTEQAQTIITIDRKPKLSQFFSDIQNSTGREVVLLGLMIDRTEEGVGVISVSGEASDRQSLAQFRDQIEMLGYVESVDLPIANLAQNQDIQFNLRVIVNNDAL